MKSRCSNPNNHKFELYGKRGITVCKEWASSFMAFYTWATANGYEKGLSLDRIDEVSGGQFCVAAVSIPCVAVGV